MKDVWEPIAREITVIVAEGISAPLGSVTLPRISPVAMPAWGTASARAA